ncbi:MAG: C-GCAxxG-C-C family protein [Candidatus Thorarchaeota archaeon]
MSKKASSAAKKYFESDYNCAQAVLRSVLEHEGLMFDEATLLTAGFGGGMSYQGRTCGAVTGAIMALGVLAGQKHSDVNEHKKLSGKYAYKFQSAFIEGYGTTLCDDLIEVDMKIPDERKKASDAGVFTEICPQFVERAVEIVLNLYRK